MNRHERRKNAAEAKVSSDIFPGAHGPAQPNMAALLPKLMETLEACLPGTNITLFVGEKIAPTPGTLPRFNYISNGARADMVAVLTAFVVKNRELFKILDDFEAEPPAGTEQ